MRRLKLTFGALILALFPLGTSEAQTGGTYITTSDVDATENAAAARLAESNRTISDIMIRHVDVGDEQLGVAVVQRTKRERGGPLRGIAHVKLDEIYYVLSGEGTMVTGGPITETSLSEGGMLGPMRSGLMRSGLMRGGTSQQMGPGDIAIIPKGSPTRGAKSRATPSATSCSGRTRTR